MRDWCEWIGAAALLAVATFLSYAFATAGHPSALWFWRDVLGLM